MTLQMKASIVQGPSADKTDKWVTAILDLIKMTNQGRLLWKRDMVRSPLFPLYYAALGEQTLTFAVPAPERETSPINAQYRARPRLEVSGPIPDRLVSFPDIAPLNALEKAILAQINTDADDVLQLIHEAAADPETLPG